MGKRLSIEFLSGIGHIFVMARAYSIVAPR